MKTHQLTFLLNQADPSGELEVTVMGADVYFVSNDPAHHDGPYQRLRRDPVKAPSYNVCGADYVGAGSKITIHPYSISDMLLDNPEASVGFIDLSDDIRQYYEAQVEETRQTYRRWDQESINSRFAQYVQRRLGEEWNEDCAEGEVQRIAMEWAEANLRESDPIDPDLHKTTLVCKTGNPSSPEVTTYLSWNDKQMRMWDRTVEVTFEEGKLGFVKKDAP